MSRGNRSGVALYLIDVGSADIENLVLTDVRSPNSCLRILLSSKYWLESAPPGHSILKRRGQPEPERANGRPQTGRPY